VAGIAAVMELRKSFKHSLLNAGLLNEDHALLVGEGLAGWPRTMSVRRCFRRSESQLFAIGTAGGWRACIGGARNYCAIDAGSTSSIDAASLSPLKQARTAVIRNRYTAAP